VIDPDTKHNYAIKRISKREGGKNMIGEMEILKSKNLHHINLVRYFTFFEEEEFINIIMELCEEGNLEDFIKKFKNSIIPEEVYLIFTLIN
jgi:serine/threonine protein kinase